MGILILRKQIHDLVSPTPGLAPSFFHSMFLFFFFLIILALFVYLAVSSLSCHTQDLHCMARTL